MRAILILILAAGAGCDDNCDPGQRYEHGLCYATLDGGVADVAPDASAASDAP